MNKKEVRKIVDDTIREVFANDGLLKVMHEVHLKPYHVFRIRQKVKMRIGEIYDLEFPESEIKPITEKEFLNQIIGFIKNDH